MKPRNVDNRILLIGGMILAGIVIASAWFFVQGSIVPDSKVDSISFYHLTDGAYAYDRMQDTFNEEYAGVHGDNARVGDYRFILDPSASNSAYGKYGTDSCFAVPRVERNGQVIDDYSLQNNPIVRYSGWVDKQSTDNRVQQYGEIEATFAVAFFMEEAVYYGTYYGVEQCYGPFNQYSLTVPFEEISMQSQAPSNVTEGEPVNVDFRFENGWKPLIADLRGEACISDNYCSSFSRENVPVPVGGTTVAVEAADPVSNFTGDVSVDFEGTLSLDMERFQAENVVVDCNGDGELQDASECSELKIAELQGDELVNVIPDPEEPPNQGGGVFTFISRVITGIVRFLSFGG